jgi:hypothetical protein
MLKSFQTRSRRLKSLGSRADIPRVDERRDVEAWADGLLEQHRTAPPGSSFEDEPVIEHMRQRSRYYAAQSRRFASIEAVLTLVGIVLLCVFGFAFYSSF